MRAAVMTLILGTVALAQPARADGIFVVQPTAVSDAKAVFATVESPRVVPARARIGGTVAELAVKEGDQVALGQVVATVGDEKLALQLKSLDAQIAGLEAQRAKAETDLARAEELVSRGTIPRTRLDEARTAFEVAANMLRSRIAERSVIQQQLAEGSVLAPAAGRVLKVPLTTGTVIMPGEPVAHIAERNFVLRLRVPERHARILKAGDPVRIDGRELGTSEPRFGTIRLVYPQIEDGRVVADARRHQTVARRTGSPWRQNRHPQPHLGCSVSGRAGCAPYPRPRLDHSCARGASQSDSTGVLGDPKVSASSSALQQG
jgi:RND family efflux transporter MFP subunit